MDPLPLTGAQKTFLRGRGQLLGSTLTLGRAGITPEFVMELEQRLAADELVKLRFAGADRKQRAELCPRIAERTGCSWVGSVGHTALFFRPNPDPAKRRVELPGGTAAHSAADAEPRDAAG
jgi:RNA-binding protein